ncbi:hypothetical protein RvY_05730 [Ramazzottius varieornatus]|uniref:Uncharacterized protein n=1 Tax=Ramazzottius varieornatus TaxID=947166 RepID=A0A1D1V1M9_RAMVA|nr:hypothetical protein RvY_05730 [Ramazzottius varieornatus]
MAHATASRKFTSVYMRPWSMVRPLTRFQEVGRTCTVFPPTKDISFEKQTPSKGLSLITSATFRTISLTET